MLLASTQDANYMYNYNQQFDDNTDTAYMANAHAQAVMLGGLQQQKNGRMSNASTWAGNDMDSMSSGDSYWEMPGSAMPMGYMMHPESVAQQGQDQQQRVLVPIPVVQTPFGYMPIGPGAPGSPMSQGSPMGQQTPVMASPTGGMAMMPHVLGAPNGDASTPTSMSMWGKGEKGQRPVQVSPTSPTMMMQAGTPVSHGESGMQMMQPVAVAMIPTGGMGAMAMPMPGMAGMQAMPVPPPGYMLKCVNNEAPGQHSDDPQAPSAGEKKPRLLEELLPGGVRRRVTREELGRKVFVGGLNPTTTTDDLRNYFSEFGVVTDSCVITDSTSKASRGFGFVEFEGKIPDGLLDQQHIIDQRRCGVREYGHSTAPSP
jgi:hypothetical protein